MAKLTPRARAVVLTVGVLAAVGLFVGALYLLGGGTWQKPEDRSRVLRPPSVAPSLPGGQMDPNMTRVQEQAEQQWVEEARKTGGSAVATIRELEKQPAAPVEQLPPPPAANAERDRRAQEQERRRQAGSKRKALEALLASWRPDTHTVVAASLVLEKQEAPEQATKAPVVPTLKINPGEEIYYGYLITEVNSDEPGPVLAEITTGPLKGARLLGALQRKEEKVILQFNQLTLNGQTAGVNAYAVDPITARTGLASEVNRRTFSRWAAVLASAFLEGLQTAVLAKGNVVTPGLGTVVVERDYDGRDIAAIAIGEIGRRTQPLAEEYFRRPPTITVASGVGIGILFVEPAEVPISGRAKAVSAEASR